MPGLRLLALGRRETEGGNVNGKLDAERLADEHCRAAIAAAEKATTPEYVRTDDATGKPLLIPARAMAAGMLAHLKAAYERNHQRRAA